MEKPKFMEKIQLSAPKITDIGEFEIGMEINTRIQPVETLDDAITKEIIKIAKEEGINDVLLLNKNTIASALAKQVPKKVTHEATLYKCCTCPTCKNVVDEHTDFLDKRVRVTVQYCKFCGQALDWSDKE